MNNDKIRNSTEFVDDIKEPSTTNIPSKSSSIINDNSNIIEFSSDDESDIDMDLMHSDNDLQMNEWDKVLIADSYKSAYQCIEQYLLKDEDLNNICNKNDIPINLNNEEVLKLEKYKNILLKGDIFIKYKRGRNSNKRNIWVTPSLSYIIWGEIKKRS